VAAATRRKRDASCAFAREGARRHRASDGGGARAAANARVILSVAI